MRHAITGALGYTGRAVAARLVSRGERVVTLTNSRRPNPFGEGLEVRPLAFDDPGALAASLRGVDVLHNTYWVRFNHRRFNFAEAVRNSRTLFEAAGRAGVGRIVHVSILHAREADDLGYYRGKREVEEALEGSGIPHAILRPGVLFGDSGPLTDILINNIAWVLRRLPVFGLFGDGAYRLRPLHVDDMAALMVEHAGREGNTAADAVGPEAYSYRKLVRMLARAIGVRRAIVGLPAWAGLGVGGVLGPVLGDVVVTREEVKGLMRGLLDSDAPAAGPTGLSEWAGRHRGTLGMRYASEVGRRVRA